MPKSKAKKRWAKNAYTTHKLNDLNEEKLPMEGVQSGHGRGASKVQPETLSQIETTPIKPKLC